MAKVAMVERDKKRERLAKKYAKKREELKAKIKNPSTDFGERMEAVMELSELPRNSSRSRQRNRCELTGRPRGYYRKFRMSRIALRELASAGMIPGVTKSSW